MAEVVRTPIGPDARLPTRRTLDERFFVRWPRSYAALSRALSLLPPRSRLRRALLRRAALPGWAAFARGDVDLMVVLYAPDCHWESLPDLVAAGMRNSYHGHAGVREVSADWREVWEWIDSILHEMVDAGNPVIILGHQRVRARGSGIEFEIPFANVVSFERGLIARQRDFTDAHEALRASGIATGGAGGNSGTREGSL